MKVVKGRAVRAWDWMEENDLDLPLAYIISAVIVIGTVVLFGHIADEYSKSVIEEYYLRR